MMPIMASTAMYGAPLCDAWGKSGRQKRIMPYVPILRSTPARITEPAVAPDADEEDHGDEHDFPEEEEEEEIEREEDADDADFEHQQHDEKFLDAFVNAVPRGDDGDGGEESRQDDEKDAEAVDAEVIVDGRRGDRVEIFIELVAGGAESNFAEAQV